MMALALHLHMKLFLLLSFICVASAAHVTDCDAGMVGGELSGELTSPRHPMDYPDNSYCLWTISVPHGKIYIVVEAFAIEYSSFCSKDILAIKDSGEKQYIHICGNGTLGFTSMSNSVEVMFRSDWNKHFKGWKLRYFAEGVQIPGPFSPAVTPPPAMPSSAECGGVYTQDTGVVTSPFYPNEYTGELYCVYTISTRPDGIISLNFTDFDVEHYAGCIYDSVQVYDTETDQQLTNLCGRVSTLIVGVSNSVKVVFKSDDSVHGKGWKLNWSSQMECGGHLYEKKGKLASSGYVHSYYSHNRMCDWTITVPNGIIAVEVTYFNVHYYQTCSSRDSLTIFDGNSYAQRDQICGNVSKIVIGQSDSFRIVFQTDKDLRSVGWSLTWNTVSCGSDKYGSQGVLSSTDHLADFPGSSFCVWKIIRPYGIIGLDVNSDDVDHHGNCDYDVLSFYDGTSGKLLGKHCGKGNMHINGKSESVLVVFSNYDYLHNPGWTIFWNGYMPSTTSKPTTKDRNDCGGNYYQMYGSVTSPNYPHAHYPHNAVCRWNITIPRGIVVIHITDMNIEYHSECSWDSLKFYDGYNNLPLDVHCGTGPREVNGISRSVVVVFTTDGNGADYGFRLNWSTYQMYSPTTASPTTKRELCGGNIHQQEGTLVSPDYPNNYPHNIRCEWVITIPSGVIAVNIFESDIEHHQNCQWDSLKFYDGHSGQQLAVHCGYETRYVTGQSASMKVIFSTDHLVNGDGWKLRWGPVSWIIPNPTTTTTTTTHRPPFQCGETIYREEGMLSSPNYPNNYPNNAHCEWIITIPHGIVSIEVLELDLEHHTDCAWDYLKFQDRYSGELLDTVCGTGSRFVTGVSNSVKITFSSDHMQSGKGWKLTWGPYWRMYTTTPSPATITTPVPTCGENIYRQEGTLTSPNYPNNYPNNLHCEWTITTSHAIMAIKVLDIGIEGHQECGWDYLKFEDGHSGTHLGTHCGTEARDVIGISNSIKIIFISDHARNGKGWRLEWGAYWKMFSTTTTPDHHPAPCGGVFTQQTGTLTSPNYPHDYPNNLNCVWQITIPSGIISIQVTNFDVEDDSSCSKDSLAVYDGDVIIDLHCGSGVRLITGYSNAVRIIFKTDGSGTGSGWRLVWSEMMDI